MKETNIFVHPEVSFQFPLGEKQKKERVKPLSNLAAGDHYFFILGRSGGYRLDKIHFFKDGVQGFQDESEPTTPVLPGS